MPGHQHKGHSHGPPPSSGGAKQERGKIRKSIQALRDTDSPDTIEESFTLLCACTEEADQKFILEEGGLDVVLSKATGDAPPMQKGKAYGVLMVLSQNESLKEQVGKIVMPTLIEQLIIMGKPGADSTIAPPVLGALFLLTTEDKNREQVGASEAPGAILNLAWRCRAQEMILNPCLAATYTLMREDRCRTSFLAARAEGEGVNQDAGDLLLGQVFSHTLSGKSAATGEVTAYVCGSMLNALHGQPNVAAILPPTHFIPILAKVAKEFPLKQPQNIMVVANICGAVANLSREESVCEMVAKEGMVPMVVEALTFPQPVPQLMQYSAMCLSNLAASTLVVDMVVECDGPKRLCTLWKQFAHTPLALPYSSIASRLANSSPASREALAKSGAIELAVSSLQSLPMQTGREQAAVMGSLINILFDNNDNRQAALKFNVPVIAVGLLEKARDKEEVQRAGLGVLQQVALSPECKKKMHLPSIKKAANAAKAAHPGNEAVLGAVDNLIGVLEDKEE